MRRRPGDARTAGLEMRRPCTDKGEASPTHQMDHASENMVATAQTRGRLISTRVAFTLAGAVPGTPAFAPLAAESARAPTAAVPSRRSSG